MKVKDSNGEIKKEQWYWPDVFYNGLSGYLSILMNQQIHVGC